MSMLTEIMMRVSQMTLDTHQLQFLIADHNFCYILCPHRSQSNDMLQSLEVKYGSRVQDEWKLLSVL